MAGGDPTGAGILTPSGQPVPLDPRVKRFLDVLAAGNPPSRCTRASSSGAAARRAHEARRDPKSRWLVQERTVPGPAGPLAVRVYTPLDAPVESLPGLVYLHGGGLVAGTIDTHAPIARAWRMRVPAA